MILVFKTDIIERDHVEIIAAGLNTMGTISRWHVDLEDCDRILKVETAQDVGKEILDLLRLKGFNCEELD